MAAGETLESQKKKKHNRAMWRMEIIEFGDWLLGRVAHLLFQTGATAHVFTALNKSAMLPSENLSEKAIS